MAIKVTKNLTKVTISSVGVQGQKGEKGDSAQSSDVSLLVTTSSFNNFTSSYLSDSASFANRINLGTNEQNLSSYVSSSVFNSYTSSNDNVRNTILQTTISLNSKTGSFATTGSNTFIGTETLSGSILISGSIVPNTGVGTFTSSFSLGSPTNAWKDLYLSHGSIIFVDAITQATSSFSISTDETEGENTVQYTAAITASSFIGDGSRLTNLPSTTNWKTFTPTTIRNTEQLTFSGDYILEDAYLLIEGGDYEVEYSPNKYFKKEGSIFIGGNLLVKDSTIVNNGKISVGGEVILIGSSQIIGTGTII